jgi:ABC-type glycerol-3-phosphate transport system substrate-binding protein
MLKRMLLVVMVVVMVFSSFACNKGKEDTKPETSTTVDDQGDNYGEIVDGFFRYNETVVLDTIASYEAQLVDRPDESWIYKFAKDKFNIEFEVEHIPASEEKDKSTLLFASDDLPQCFLPWTAFQDMGQQAIYGDKEKQLSPINKYITKDIMPNFSKAVEELPMIISVCSTYGGNMYTVPVILQRFEYSVNPSIQPVWYYEKWFDDINKLETLLNKLIAVE